MTDDFLKKIPLKELKSSFAKLQQEYKNADKPPRLTSYADIIYYFLCRAPATSKVLEKVFRELYFVKVETLLDVGAGPLSATLQALESFPGLKKSIAIENNPLFVQFAREYWKEKACALVQDKRDFSTIDTFPPADLGVFSYALSEVEVKKQQEIAWRVFAAVQVLVIIEPGTPQHNARLLAIRDFMIAQGAHLVAPCPHMRKCPLAQTDKWCHFSARLARSSLHRQIKEGEKGFEDEKYFYMVFSHIPHPQVDNRLLSPVRKDKRGLQVDICGKDSYGSQLLTKSNPDYKLVSKLTWGDFY